MICASVCSEIHLIFESRKCGCIIGNLYDNYLRERFGLLNGGLMHCAMLQSSNGLGLQALSGRDYCDVTLQFPSDTIAKWVGFPSHSDIFMASILR